MKWLIVAVFANIQGDVYIFTDPSFESKVECESAMNDPLNIPRYVAKMMEVYNYNPPKLRTIGCLDEDTIKELLKTSKTSGNNV
tara:strand:- start:284 stop:535 length:252 start_codon:yes stop_codon:yes gene_type:complete